MIGFTRRHHIAERLFSSFPGGPDQPAAHFPCIKRLNITKFNSLSLLFGKNGQPGKTRDCGFQNRPVYLTFQRHMLHDRMIGRPPL
ncbi:hypothetical protein D3C81_1780400 [compost metagenome]